MEKQMKKTEVTEKSNPSSAAFSSYHSESCCLVKSFAYMTIFQATLKAVTPYLRG